MMSVGLKLGLIPAYLFCVLPKMYHLHSWIELENNMLGDQFPRKNSRRHNSIYSRHSVIGHVR